MLILYLLIVGVPIVIFFLDRWNITDVLDFMKNIEGDMWFEYISNYTYAYGYINNPNLGQAAEMSVSFSGINVQRYGTWKNINKASVQIGDSWKSVQDISVLKNGSWYTLPKTSSMIFI